MDVDKKKTLSDSLRGFVWNLTRFAPIKSLNNDSWKSMFSLMVSFSYEGFKKSSVLN